MNCQSLILAAIIWSLLFLGLASVPPLAKAKPPEGKDWVLAWADEFDGPAIDTTKWNYFDGWGFSPWREAFYTQDDAFLENGYLIIRSRKDGDRLYTGGLTSRGKFEHQYGYYEIRARFTDLEALGQWVAFWLFVDDPFPYDNNLSTGVEVDIMEYPGTGETIHQGIHWGNSLMHTSTTLGLRQGFHTIGLEWTPEEYVFYIDDKEVWRTNAGVSQAKQWMLLTLEIGEGTMGKDHSISNYLNLLPDYWAVDYVRVYDLSKKNVGKVSAPRISK